MRSRLLHTAAASQSVPTHPSPGDVCVGCVHKPNPRSSHYFYLKGVVYFKAPDDHAGAASWILLCDACFMKHVGHLKEDINKGLVQIGCDMIWPDDLQVTFLQKS